MDCLVVLVGTGTHQGTQNFFCHNIKGSEPGVALLAFCLSRKILICVLIV